MTISFSNQLDSKHQPFLAGCIPVESLTRCRPVKSSHPKWYLKDSEGPESVPILEDTKENDYLLQTYSHEDWEKKVSKYPSLVALPILHCSLPIFLLAYLALASPAACTPKSRLRYLSHGKPRKESKRFGKNHLPIWGGYHDSNTMTKNVWFLGFLVFYHSSNTMFFTQRLQKDPHDRRIPASLQGCSLPPGCHDKCPWQLSWNWGKWPRKADHRICSHCMCLYLFLVIVYIYI